MGIKTSANSQRLGISPQRKYQRSKKFRKVRKRYLQSPKGRYAAHKQNAKNRGVPFELTFEQWLAVWVGSGHFERRGNKTGAGYVMARHGDQGAYAVGNVSIVRHRVNIADRNRNYAMAKRSRIAWDWYKDAPQEPPAPIEDRPDPEVPF